METKIDTIFSQRNRIVVSAPYKYINFFRGIRFVEVGNLEYRA